MRNPRLDASENLARAHIARAVPPANDDRAQRVEYSHARRLTEGVRELSELCGGLPVGTRRSGIFCCELVAQGAELPEIPFKTSLGFVDLDPPRVSVKLILRCLCVGNGDTGVIECSKHICDVRFVCLPLSVRL